MSIPLVKSLFKFSCGSCEPNVLGNATTLVANNPLLFLWYKSNSKENNPLNIERSNPISSNLALYQVKFVFVIEGAEMPEVVVPSLNSYIPTLRL